MMMFSDYFSDLAEAVFSCLGQISMLITLCTTQLGQLCTHSFFFFSHWEEIPSLLWALFNFIDAFLSNHIELLKWLFFGSYERSWIWTL